MRWAQSCRRIVRDTVNSASRPLLHAVMTPAQTLRPSPPRAAAGRKAGDGHRYIAEIAMCHTALWQCVRNAMFPFRMEPRSSRPCRNSKRRTPNNNGLKGLGPLGKFMSPMPR